MDTLRAGRRRRNRRGVPARTPPRRSSADRRRIEHVRRPARVISFPGQTRVRRTFGRRRRGRAALGRRGRGRGPVHRRRASARPMWESRGSSAVATTGRSDGHADAARDRAAPPAVRVDSAARTIAADDAFLSELELALDRPHTRELSRVRRVHAARAGNRIIR